MSAEGERETRRTRGSRAGLNRQRILDVAKRMAPQSVTMQAVALELGVDPKALNYHVQDRDGLLQLIAADAFASRFASTTISEAADWRTASRVFAVSVKDSLLATGVLAIHFHLQDEADLIGLGPAEDVLRRMLAAGFEETDAARWLSLLVLNAVGFARDAIATHRDGDDTRESEVRTALDSAAESDFSSLRHLVGLDYRTDDDAQFLFILEVLIRGMESLAHPV